MLNGSPGYVNPSGLTVYVFDADLAGGNNTSSCSGACATNWPPVAPPAGVTISAPWSTFVRGDGRTQLSYSGRALYTFIGDGAPGQATGDGVNAFGGLWHVARPSSAPAPSPTPTGTATPQGSYSAARRP